MSPNPQSRTPEGREPPRWQTIPGAFSAEVYAYLRKPHVLSCNSYLIRTDRSIAVINPGGLPEQTAALAEEMQRVPGAGLSLEEIPDDPDGFLDYLISSLSLVPVFRGVEIGVKPENAAVPVRIARERFLDGLKRLLEDPAEEGAASIGFTAQTAETGPCLIVRVEFARPIYRLGDQLLQPHHRRLDLSGARRDRALLEPGPGFHPAVLRVVGGRIICFSGSP